MFYILEFTISQNQKLIRQENSMRILYIKFLIHDVMRRKNFKIKTILTHKESINGSVLKDFSLLES